MFYMKRSTPDILRF